MDAVILIIAVLVAVVSAIWLAIVLNGFFALLAVPHIVLTGVILHRAKQLAKSEDAA